MNIDIFACIHFRGFMKMRIKIPVLVIPVSIGYYKSIFLQCIYFRGNYAKIYTAQKCLRSQNTSLLFGEIKVIVEKNKESMKSRSRNLPGEKM